MAIFVLPHCFRLTIVFRYRCNPQVGPACFGDCLEHDEFETCPPSPPTPTSDIYTGFTDPLCERSGSCTWNITTQSTRQSTEPILMTTPSEETNKSTDQIPSASSNNVTDSTSGELVDTTTTKSVYQDSAMLQNSTTTGKSKSSTLDFSDIFTTMTQHSLTTSDARFAASTTPEEITVKLDREIATTKENTKVTSSTKNLNRLSAALTSKSSVKNMDIRSKLSSAMTPELSTTPDGISTKMDDDPVYWPAIVGGVLGGIAVMSAIGFCIYYRRQK